MRRTIRATLLLLTLLLLLAPSHVFAHAKLVQSEPASNSRLAESPETIRLVFNEELEIVGKNALQMTDSRGTDVTLNDIQLGDDGVSLIAELDTLMPDTYTVAYTVLSKDGHTVAGRYSFTLLGTSTTIEQPAQMADERTAATPPSDKTLPPIVIEGEPFAGANKAELLSVYTGNDGLKTVFYIVFLPLLGLVLWSIVLRGRTEEQIKRLRLWTLQFQRLFFLVLLGIIVHFISQSTGFDDVSALQRALLDTTIGQSWLMLLGLSVIGMFALQRVKLFDVIWLLAAVAAKARIGHAVATEEPLVAAVMAGLHLLAAAVWIGGLLLVLLMWGRYRYEAERFLPMYSGASLTAVSVLAITGVAGSTLYLPDLTYLLETRWGLFLIGKLVGLVITMILATWIRGRMKRSGSHRVGALLRTDFLMMLIVAAMAALMTQSEPIPSNKPVHWHVMGEDVHMTATISPLDVGLNNYGVTVWLPEGSNPPRSVELRLLPGKSGDDMQVIPLQRLAGGEDGELVFVGFEDFYYQATGEELNRPGWWRYIIAITDDRGQTWEYHRTTKIY